MALVEKVRKDKVSRMKLFAFLLLFAVNVLFSSFGAPPNSTPSPSLRKQWVTLKADVRFPLKGWRVTALKGTKVEVLGDASLPTITLSYAGMSTTADRDVTDLDDSSKRP